LAGAEASPSGEEVKSLASLFVPTIGLLDVILGCLVLYCGRLILGPGLESLFPSTGQTFVDIGLLVSAAALTGKLVLLFVTGFLMVIVEFLWWYFNSDGLDKALLSYRVATGRKDLQQEVDPLELAVSYLALDSPARAASIEQINSAAQFAYGGGILCVPFSYYIGHAFGNRGFVLVIVAGVLLVILGYFQQRTYYKTVMSSLLAGRGAVEQAATKGGL
jgi:hypothetical protein